MWCLGSELAGGHTLGTSPCTHISSSAIPGLFSQSLEIGAIRFTNGWTFLGICLHNAIRTHVLNILLGLKGSFHNMALCGLQKRVGGRKKGLGLY